MRASRLLTLQMLLETRGRMSATALAEALEVSVRTLYRDVDELSAAGVPVYAERGRNGGFALLPGWKTTLTGLTPGEAEAVFLSGLAGPAADLGLAQQAQSAQLKVLASLPTPMQGDARRVSSRFHLDPIDWYREPDALPHLPAASQAVWEERQLSIRYESWEKTAARVVHPLGLVLKAGIWYLVAARDGAPRTYRVSNLLDAQLLDARAVRPRSFDLAKYWKAAVKRFETDINTGYADVLATPEGLAQMRRMSAAHARAVAQALDGKAKRKDGRIVVRVPTESLAHAAGQLLRLAPEVEVTAPAALRAAIRARIAAAQSLYA